MNKKTLLTIILLTTMLIIPFALANGDPIPGGSGNPHFYLETDVEGVETGNAIHLTITYAEYPGVVYNVVIVNGNFVLNGLALWNNELDQIHASGTATLSGDTWILEGTWNTNIPD